MKTTAVAMELAKRYAVDMPITSEVYGVLYEGRTAEEGYRGLTRRSPGSEDETD